MSNHWMTTYSGIRFDLKNPKPSMIDIEDIAHALSMKVRFNGHCSKFYTVAQHSILVSERCSPENALWGLLHDAAEAYLADVHRPLKRMLPVFKKIEGRVEIAIMDNFGLPHNMPYEVNEVDNDLLIMEAKMLDIDTTGWQHERDLPLLEVPLLSVEESKVWFLRRFHNLYKKHKDKGVTS